jgi:hypothetical protein
VTVTVIIVNYRSAKLVGELLGSMAGRDRGWPYRVVVVDNASGDGSVEAMRVKVAELGMGDSVQILDSGQNRGFGAGNNFGAAAALRSADRPDLLWFLNPDTLVDNVELDRAIEWFERDARVGIVGTGLMDDRGERHLGGRRDLSPLGEFVRQAGAFGVLRNYAVSDPELDRPGPVDWVSGASFFMRTTAFESLGGFDEEFFLYFEEVDLCRRARQAGWKVVYEPRVSIVHLEGQSTGVGQSRAFPPYWYESRRRYFVKHLGRLGLARADLAWGLGRAVGLLRRKPGDACRWRDLWRCDAPVVLRGERLAIGMQG